MSRERDKSAPDPVAEIVNRYGRRASSARREPTGRFWQRLAESVSREPTVSREIERTVRPPLTGGAPLEQERDAPEVPLRVTAPASDDDDLGEIEVDLTSRSRAPSGAQARAPSAPGRPVLDAPAPAPERGPPAPAVPVAAVAEGAPIDITLPDGSTLTLAGRRLEGPDGRSRLLAADAPGNPRWLLDALSALARGTQAALQRVATARSAGEALAPEPLPSARPPTDEMPAVAPTAEATAAELLADVALPDDLILPEGLLAALAEGAAAAVEGDELPLWDGLPPLPEGEAPAAPQTREPAASAPRAHRASVRLGGAAAEQGARSRSGSQPAVRSAERSPSAPQPSLGEAPPTQPGKRRRPTAAPPAEAHPERVRPARPPLRGHPTPPPARALARAPALVLGVDLGHTYARVGVMRPQMELLGDAQGRRALPVVVGFPQRDEVVLGWEARQLRGERPELTLAHFTRLMGLSLDQAQSAGVLDAAGLPAQGSSGGELLFEAHRRELTAARLVTLLLAELRAVASQALAQPVADAVFSVPLGLTARQRQVLREAAGQAGWAGVSLVDAPWAALRAWGLDQHPGVVAVYDLGGTSFEFCVLQTGSPAERRVLGMASEAGVGSMLLDAALAGRVAERFGRATGIDLRARPAAWQLLLAACEDAKCQLSERNAVQVVAGELLEPSLLAEAQHSMGVTYRLTRKELSELAGGVVDRSLGVVVRVLAQAGLATGALSAVVLCGGGALSPLVRDAVAGFFEREPLAHDAQLAGVHGAASLGAAGEARVEAMTHADG